MDVDNNPAFRSNHVGEDDLHIEVNSLAKKQQVSPVKGLDTLSSFVAIIGVRTVAII